MIATIGLAERNWLVVDARAIESGQRPIVEHERWQMELRVHTVDDLEFEEAARLPDRSNN